VMAAGMVVILTARSPVGPPEPVPGAPGSGATRRKRVAVPA
jgi:hypothetical protein